MLKLEFARLTAPDQIERVGGVSLGMTQPRYNQVVLVQGVSPPSRNEPAEHSPGVAYPMRRAGVCLMEETQTLADSRAGILLGLASRALGPLPVAGHPADELAQLPAASTKRCLRWRRAWRDLRS